MNRREALFGTSAFTAALALGTLSCAKSAVAHAAEGAHVHGGDPALADAALACIKAGNACLAHCIAMAQNGDTSMAGCLATVTDMLAAMEALSKLAARGGKRLPDTARALVAYCEDCAAECQKHADHHPVCKECFDACTRTVAALKKG